ncbi:MAG TPA: hypothetical protein VGM56_00435 [Byssovorax sp.]|jgi:hypothetical protein
MAARHPDAIAPHRSAPPADTVMLAVPVPRSALTMTAALPELLSQRNVEAALGIPSRIYLELLRNSALPFEVTRVGKLRIVDRASFVLWLRRRTEAAEVSVPDDVDGAAELAMELGLRRVSGRPPRRR